MAECPSNIGSLAPPPRELISASSPHITVITAKSLQMGQPAAKLALGKLIDDLGRASAVAQGLHTAVSSAARLVSSPDQTCYVAYEGHNALGFIKASTAVAQSVHPPIPSKYTCLWIAGRTTTAVCSPRVGAGRDHASCRIRLLCGVDCAAAGRRVATL
jgi:hypothetical protein